MQAGQGGRTGRQVDIFGLTYVVCVAFRAIFITMVTMKKYEGHIVIVVTVPNAFLTRKSV
jgi:hypothetical protein